MKQIINGRLWDTTFMNEITSQTFTKIDPVTRREVQYRRVLWREYVLKPGHTIADTWVEGSYGRHIVVDNCDLTKGQFILETSRGWSADCGTLVPITEDEARQWLETNCPSETDKYESVFGKAVNPWRDDGTANALERLDSKLTAAVWDRERAEKRAAESEAEVTRLKARLGELEAKLETTGYALQA